MPDFGSPGGFGSALGGSSDLMGIMTGETEEQRRKRLMAQQQRQLLPSAGLTAGASSLGLTGAGYGVSLR